MKFTIITSNKPRHNYLVNKISTIASSVNVIQESSTIFPGQNPGRNLQSTTMSNYFEKVNVSQNRFFKKHYLIRSHSNLKLLPLQFGDLNKIDLKLIKKDFLNSDYYIVFGSSFIKNKLLNFLIKKKAINIHMGLSPFFRGTDCNFWALNDGYGHLVGATIHYLSRKLDAGDIIYHAISEKTNNIHDYTMSTVKSAIKSLTMNFKNRKIFKMKSIKQNSRKLIRYSSKKDFKDKIIKNFYKKNYFKFYKTGLEKELIAPYKLKKNQFFND